MFKVAFLLPGATAAALFTATAGVYAQDGDANRYTMERTDDGIVRMDTATGEMSLCQERDGRIACALAGDERSALDERIARLEQRLSAMEKEIADLKADRATLPTDKDLDRAMGAMENFMRRFFKMVDDLNKDFKDRTGEPHPAPGPQDT